MLPPILAVVVNFRRNSLNCIPTLHPIARKQLAYIAMGKEANNDISFYTVLSQCSDEIVVADNTSDDISVSDQLIQKPNFLLHDCASASDVSFEDDEVEIDDQKEGILLTQELESLFTDLKMRVRQQDPQLQTGVRKFINRYNKMASNNSIALLASSFHCFGKTNGRTVTLTKGGTVRKGRRIPVQATAAGRRKYGSRGKACCVVGRPPAKKQKLNLKQAARFKLPSRHKAKGKRPHNLASNVMKGTQNAGKW